jgi:hypothetical protein
MLRRVAQVRTGFSAQPIATIITMKSITKLGTTLAITSTQRRNIKYVPPKSLILQEPPGAKSKKTTFFMQLDVAVRCNKGQAVGGIDFCNSYRD